MPQALPPHYLQLVSDAALKSFWRKRTLRDFLRRCGVSERHLASWAEDETKRDFLAKTFSRLEAVDAGIRVITRMADSLVEQTAFPDLESWEDSSEKIAQARKAIAALNVYRSNQREEAVGARERAESAKRVQAIREQQLKQQQDLGKLNERLNKLSRDIGKQEAGYAFQVWFYDLVDYFEVANRRPYVTEGRQIDGSITIEGTTYLVELKFTNGQAAATDISDFYKKVTDKADNTMGAMVSMSGYSSVATSEASGPRTPLLLFDHRHLYVLLMGAMTLSELVSRARRHSSQTGEALLDPKSFGS